MPSHLHSYIFCAHFQVQICSQGTLFEGIMASLPVGRVLQAMAAVVPARPSFRSSEPARVELSLSSPRAHISTKPMVKNEEPVQSPIGNLIQALSLDVNAEKVRATTEQRLTKLSESKENHLGIFSGVKPLITIDGSPAVLNLREDFFPPGRFHFAPQSCPKMPTPESQRRLLTFDFDPESQSLVMKLVDGKLPAADGSRRSHNCVVRV